MFVELPTSALTLVGPDWLVEGVDEHHRVRLVPYTKAHRPALDSALTRSAIISKASRLSFRAGSPYIGTLATLSVTDRIAIY